MIKTPMNYGLPHEILREHQSESILWCFDLKGFGAIEAPTGCGKTAMPAAVSTEKSVVALCRTKFLQKNNYEGIYGFDAHYGRVNYDCIHPDAPPGTTCAECLHLEDGMYWCKHSDDCLYLQSKHRAMNSPRASLNYAYWCASHWKDGHAPQVLFCDEGHNLAAITTDWAGCTVSAKDRIEWSLPPFPEISRRSQNALFVQVVKNPVDEALGWLTKAGRETGKQSTALEKIVGGSEEIRRRSRDCEKMERKIDNCAEALRQNSEDWYIRSGPEAQSYGVEKRPAFVCRPLTAKHHFSSMFLDGHSTVAMSATIGDFETFTEELGVAEYSSRVVPNRFPPESRPIYILDTPRMGWKKDESHDDRMKRFDYQADAIAKFIEQWPSTWCGLIHVSRITEERYLAQRLQRHGLAGRVWYIPEHQESYFPTDKQLVAWTEYKRRVPNALLVTCCFGEGYDGLDEKINVTAKVPYPRMGDAGSFENLWMRYSRKRYDAVAATAVAQQQGRNRRGRERDYDTPDEARGANAIADGSVHRVREKLPQDVRDALVEL